MKNSGPHSLLKVFRNGLSYLLISFFIMSSFVYAEKGSTGKKVAREFAVFKIHGDIFFLSDLKTYLRGVKFFRCLSFQSLTLRSLEIDEGSLLRLPNIKKLDFLKKGEEIFMDKILKMLKISYFIKKRQGEVDKTLFKNFALKRCSSGLSDGEKLGIGVRRLMIIETFLQNRFLSKSNLGKDLEFQGYKKENEHLNAKALKKAFEKKKNKQILEAIRLFIQSLDKRIPHEHFF